MMEWHLITPEYPPQFGGVSDYTYHVATALAAAGDGVHIWCPPAPGDPPPLPGVKVYRELGSFLPADLRRVGRLLSTFSRPRRLLVQWVPHGFRLRAVNLPFCLWLWRRATLGQDAIDLMIHEPYLPFRLWKWKQNAAAAAQRLMTAVLLRSARRVWLATTAWEARCRPYAPPGRAPFAWLPVPSNIPVLADPAAVAAIRARHVPVGGPLVGHLSTYGNGIGDILLATLPALLAGRRDQRVLLLGRASDGFLGAWTRKHPALAGQVRATGELTPVELSHHLAACDVLIQPYPDGVTSRRGSLMAGLAHGLAIVTTTGPLTEPFWSQRAALCLVPVGDVAALVAGVRRLLRDRAERERLGATARALYEECFDVRHTVAALRAAAL